MHIASSFSSNTLFINITINKHPSIVWAYTSAEKPLCHPLKMPHNALCIQSNALDYPSIHSVIRTHLSSPSNHFNMCRYDGAHTHSLIILLIINCYTIVIIQSKLNKMQCSVVDCDYNVNIKMCMCWCTLPDTFRTDEHSYNRVVIGMCRHAWNAFNSNGFAFFSKIIYVCGAFVCMPEYGRTY